MLTTGKDYDYIKCEFDLPRLRVLNVCHSKSPPTHIGVQRLCRILEAFIGIEDSLIGADESDDDDELLADLKNFPQGG